MVIKKKDKNKGLSGWFDRDIDMYSSSSLTIKKWKLTGVRFKFFKSRFHKLNISRSIETRTISDYGKQVANFLSQVIDKEWTIMPRSKKGAARYLDKRLRDAGVSKFIIYY